MKFKTGDSVFSIERGWSKVIKIDPSYDYQIHVQSEGGVQDYYLPDGKFNYFHAAPSLLTREEALKKYPEYPPPVRKRKVKMYSAYIPVIKSDFFMQQTNLYLSKEALPKGDGWVIEEKEIEVEDA